MFQCTTGLMTIAFTAFLLAFTAPLARAQTQAEPLFPVYTDKERAAAVESVEQLIAEYHTLRGAENEKKQQELLTQAVEVLLPHISNPYQRNPEIWLTTAQVAVARQDADLGTIAYIAIEQLDVDDLDDRHGLGGEFVMVSWLSELAAIPTTHRHVMINAFENKPRYQEVIDLLDTLQATPAEDPSRSVIMTQIAEYYEHYWGICCLPKNQKEAFRWYTMASEYPNIKAMVRLGAAYSSGKIVVQDNSKALEWYLQAIKASEPDAPTPAVDTMSHFLGPVWVSHRTEAIQRVASIYYAGLGTEQDYAQAFKWTRLSGSTLEMVFMHANGIGTKPDMAKAAKWLEQFNKRTDECGIPLPSSPIGQQYFDGQMVTQSDTKAMNMIAAGTEQEKLDGMYSLAMIYQRGLGVTRDQTEALEWFRKAAQGGHENAQAFLKKIYQDWEP